MKLSSFTLTLSLFLGSAFSVSAATVIDFDSLSGGPIFGGELVTHQYTALGVTFVDTHSGGAHANNTLTSRIGASSAPNVLWIDQGGGSSSGHYLEILFSTPVVSLSTLFGTSLSADITLDIYNGTTLLNSQTMVGGTFIGDVRSGNIGYTSVLDITSVRLYSQPVGTDTSFNFNIDNVAIMSAVPEPSTYVLMFAGLAVMIGAVARRRTSLGSGLPICTLS